MEEAWTLARRSLEQDGWNLAVFDDDLRWPFAAKPLTISKVRGALFGVAIGDALGAAAEGQPRRRLQENPVDKLLPHNGLPAGAVTDDTELTLALARSILAVGTLDPADLASRFITAGKEMVGGGWATQQALARLERGAAWWLAGTPSAGNGAAMRAAPVGLFFEDPRTIRKAALLQAIVTHRDRSAVAGSVFHALWSGWLARGGKADATVLPWLSAALAGFEKPLSTRHKQPRRTTLASLMTEAAEFVGDVVGAFERFRTGAFVLESLPSAAVVFLTYHDDPEAALLAAANAGGDTDTIAALVGAWLGAHLGDRRLRSRTPADWWRVSASAEIERLSRLGT